MSYKTVESWINEQLSDTERKLVAIQCKRHLSSGGTEEVHTMQLAGKTWTVDQIYRTFRGRAEHSIQDKPGRHTFELLAFFDKDEMPKEHHTFVCEDGELKPLGSRSQSEGANLVGIVAQQMRFTHEAYGMMKSMAEGIAVRAVQREDVLYARETKNREEVNDAYAVVREASFQKTKAEHDMALERLKFERETQNHKIMLQQVPGLLNVATGREVLPNEAGDSALIDELALSVDPEKLDMLAASGVIDIKYVQLLKLRFKQARDKHAKEQEALKNLPAGATGDTSNVIALAIRPKDSGERGGGEHSSGEGGTGAAQ